MATKLFDTVALQVDIKEAGLKAGDVGAVVEAYSEHAFEVEFVTASGEAQAVITLTSDQVRSLGSRDILAVRELEA